MEMICERKNLNRAYKRVKANRGSPGVDGMTVGELGAWLAAHKEELVANLLDGSYRSRVVRGVEIPKPGGGMRPLGIPTVADRLVQQAILQVLDPLLDPTFSESSLRLPAPAGAPTKRYGRRRNTWAEGYAVVVDMDLEKFFDRVNHDVLMGRLARRIADKRLLRIIPPVLGGGDHEAGRGDEAIRGDSTGRARYPPCLRTSCWMRWTRRWRGGTIGFAGTLTT